MINNFIKKTSILLLIPFKLCYADAPSFDCGKARLPADKLICENSSLSDSDQELNTIYIRSKKYLSLTNDDNNLSTLIQSQKKWLVEKNKCASIECLTNLYNKRKVEIENNENWQLQNNRCSASDTFFEKSFKQHDAKILADELRFPVIIRHGIHGDNKLALSKEEFIKYFTVLFSDILKGGRNWQFDQGEFGNGSGNGGPFPYFGFKSQHPDKYIYFTSPYNDTIVLPERKAFPVELTQLDKEHNKIFLEAKSISGTYVTSGSILFVHQVSRLILK